MAEERHLSAPLLLAMLCAAPLFVWLFLRPGYSRDLRTAAFAFTLTLLAVNVAGRFGELLFR